MKSKSYGYSAVRNTGVRALVEGNLSRRPKRADRGPFWTRMGPGFAKIAATASLACLAAAPAGAISVSSPHMGDYLLIGTGAESAGGFVKLSNSDLGEDSVGVGSNGDIAITDSDGEFEVSNVEIFGETGIDCSGSIGSCEKSNSNSDFNGSNLSNSNGLNGNVDLTGVTNEIAVAANPSTGIPDFVGNHNITLTFNDGKWDSNLSLTLVAGVTVFDFVTGGNDLSLNNDDLVIDGPANAFAIFRLPSDQNFLIANSTLGVGPGGIGTNNVLFYADGSERKTDASNATIDGIAFWDLGLSNGEILFSNVTGCSQVVADKVDFSNVQLSNCGVRFSTFSTAVPEMNTMLLVAIGLAGLAMRRRLA